MSKGESHFPVATNDAIINIKFVIATVALTRARCSMYIPVCAHIFKIAKFRLQGEYNIV